MPQVFEITAPNGKKYEIEANDGVTQEQALEQFQSLPEQEWAAYEYKSPVQPKSTEVVPAKEAAPVVAPVKPPKQPTAFPDVGVQEGDFKATKLDEILDFSPESRELTKVQQRQYLALINNPNVDRETLTKFTTSIGRAVTDDIWNEIVAQRKSGKPYQAVASDTTFEGMVDEEALQEEYAPESDNFFSQIGRSAVEAWSDPASLMNALDRGKLDFFDVYREEVQKRFPDATPEQLDELEEQFIGYMARKRSEAASQAVAEDDFAPWLIGQFLAVEPYDVVPVGRAAKAGTKLGRATEKFAEGAGVAVAGDVAGQVLAINDGAQDEYDPIRTAASAALSGVISGGAQGIADVVDGGVRRIDRTAVQPRDEGAGSPAPIVVPTGRTNTKAYREQLGQAQDQIIEKVNNLASGWTNAPDIEVHPDFRSVKGIDDGALGVYTEDGKVMINTEAVLERAKKRDVSPESVVEAVIFHEGLGHHGLTSLFREDLDQFLADVYNNGSEQLQDTVDSWLRKNSNAYSQFDEGQRLVLATEEVMAEWSEKGPVARTFYDNVANYIKDFARTRLGMNLKYTEREVKAYLAVAHERTMSGEKIGATPTTAKNMDDERTPDTYSAGFKRPKVDERSKAEARKQFWKNKQNPDWNPEDPNGLPSGPKYMRGDDRVRLKRKFPGSEDGNVIGSESQAAKTFLSELGIFSGGELYRMNGEEAINRAERLGIDEEWLTYYNDAYLRSYGHDAPNTPQPDMSRYMPDVPSKYMRGDGPIDPDQLTADDLIEAENALDILNRIEYTPTVVSPDQLEAEAIARNLPPSDITRLVRAEPGKLMKKLFLYDVAATKLSDRAAKIKGEIDAQGLTPERQLAYIEATVKLNELASKIFDFQAEIGRTLAANRRVNFSRKRVRDLKAVLEEYGMEALADPETFMKYMAEIENSAKAKSKSSTTDNIISYVNIPRAIMSSADLSAPLRQGIVFIGSKEYWGSFLKMFSMLGKSGEANYNFLMKKIATHPNYELMQKARLQFSSLDGELSAREEDFQTELARKIPVYGKVVKASEQAYAGFLNKLRADMFNKFVDEYQKAGVEVDDEFLKGLGRFINAGTGRAELPEFLKPSSTLINATFFSGRLMYSRVQMLNPAFYARLPAPVRKQALKSMLAFGGIASLVNGAMNALFPEVETELDPRSSDFMKIRYGNTRFDIGGGFGQYLVLGARTLSWLYNQTLSFAERNTGIDTSDYQIANKKTVGGDFRKYGSDTFGQETYGSALADFFRTKLSPQASYAVDAMVGTDVIGREFTLEGSLASRLVPMTAGSLYEAYKEDSPVPMPVVFTASLFGVGVNTYTAPGLDPKKELKAPVEFDDKDLLDGENEMIRAEGGVVTLKKPARDMWQASLDNYYPFFVEQVSAEMGLKFEEMDDSMKKAVVKEATERARDNAKKDMMYELGLEN